MHGHSPFRDSACAAAISPAHITFDTAEFGRSVDRQMVATPETPRTLLSTSIRLVDAPSEFASSGSPQCDASGNIYFSTGIQGNYRDSPILKLSTENFKLYKLPSEDINLGQHGQMSESPDGTLWLALSGPDATTLLRFNSNGEVTSHVRLDRFANFVLEEFVAFDNDVFFVESFRRPTERDRTIKRYAAMVNASNQELSSPKLELPTLDLRSKTPPDGAVAEGSDGNLYLLESQEVVVVSQSGETIRHLRFRKPDSNYISSNISLSGGWVSIWFAKPNEQHRITHEFLVIEAVSGKVIGLYSMGEELGRGMPICFSRQDGFTFLGGIADGKMKLIVELLAKFPLHTQGFVQDVAQEQASFTPLGSLSFPALACRSRSRFSAAIRRSVAGVGAPSHTPR